MTSKTDEEIAGKAIMSLRFHPNLEDQVKFCDPGNINVILEAIRESKSAARQDTERLEEGLELLSHYHKLRPQWGYPDVERFAQDVLSSARCGLDEGEQNAKAFETFQEELRDDLGLTEPHKAEDASKQKWSPIETLDRSEMRFVLVAQDGAVRLQLWNPIGRWETGRIHHGQFERVGINDECSAPTHWMECPSAPSVESTNASGAPNLSPDPGKCPFCHLRHDPEKSNCNDPKTGALIRHRGPVSVQERSESDSAGGSQ